MLFSGLKEGIPFKRVDTGALVIDITIWKPSSVNEEPTLIISCADKSIRFYSVVSGKLIRVINDLHGHSAVRFIRKLNNTHIITGGFDGRLLVSDFATGEVSAIFRAHTKYITSLDVWEGYVVSCGYDQVVNVFKITDKNGSLKNMASMQVDSVPTSAKIAVIDPISEEKNNFISTAVIGDSNSASSSSTSPPTSPPIINGCIPVVVLCRNDSTYMFYYSLNSLRELNKVNLCDADYMSDSFTPLDIAVDEKRQRYAVGTNHIPYMRIITGIIGRKSIVNNLIVFAPQDRFSSPQLSWSRGGKGLWMTGDDGVLRGIQVIDGKVVTEIKGHQDKIRTLAVSEIDGEEIVATGGVDKKIAIWR